VMNRRQEEHSQLRTCRERKFNERLKSLTLTLTCLLVPN
jgi:hypothetical protein